VAIKRVHMFGSLSGKKREKVIKEARILESLSHPNIIAYLDSFIDDQDLMIVCEWAEAGDLKYQVRKALSKGIRFQEYTIWKYFLQIARAICYMHEQRVMHRDLKPANIFITAKAQIKVGDLGLCRGFSENTNFAYTKVGTPLYMSPEVIEGQGYEWKSDVWSLGCILYELAVLRSPFKEPGLKLVTLFKKIKEGSYEPIPDRYSSTLRDLVNLMLASDPKDRPDMTEVVRVAHEMKAFTMRERALRRAKQRAQKVLRNRSERQLQRSTTEGSAAAPDESRKLQRSTTEGSHGYSKSKARHESSQSAHREVSGGIIKNLQVNTNAAAKGAMPEVVARSSPARDRGALSPAVRRAAHASRRSSREGRVSPDQKANRNASLMSERSGSKSPISPAVRRAAQASAAMKAESSSSSQRRSRSSAKDPSSLPSNDSGSTVSLETMNILQYAREMGRRTAIQLKRRSSDESSGGGASGSTGMGASYAKPSRHVSASPIVTPAVKLNSIAPRSLYLETASATAAAAAPAPHSARDKETERHLPNINSRPLTEPSDFMSGIDPELRKQLRDMKRHPRDL